MQALYLYQNKDKDIVVKEQIQWVLLYVQRELVDIWKKNVIKNLKSRSLSYIIVGEFLADLKKEFSGRDNETMKIAELKKVEQGNKTVEEFIQELRRAARENCQDWRKWTWLILFFFLIYFSIFYFKTTRVRVDQSCYHISHNLMM